MTRLLILIFLLFFAVSPVDAIAKGNAKAAPKAAASASQGYRRAFDLLDAGHPEAAFAFAHGNDPALNKVLLGYYMAQPGSDIGFTEMAAFIDTHPAWPNLKGIIAIAEQKIPPSYTASQVAAWFTTHPPVSLAGFNRAVDATEALGQVQIAVRMIRDRWINGDFSADDLASFYSHYSNLLDADASWARLDRLLWKNDIANARHVYPYVNEDLKVLADARLALANQNRSAGLFVQQVPSNLQSDPGLLYERLHWNVRNNQDDDAISILRHAPDNLGKPEPWWEQRQIMVRRAIDKQDYRLAYTLAADNGQNTPKTLVQAEFLAGWLALRFLNDPQMALPHFVSLYDNATTPVTRARGAYWLGRTYEALDSKNEAEQAYENGAALNTTFYGQLATTRLYASPVIRAMPEPAIPDHVRQAFFNRDIVRAIERLFAIGENERAATFFRTAMDAAAQRADFALLNELAYKIERPDLAIEDFKAANQKNMMMAAGGFPILDHPLAGPPEPAFTHALIRQESMFNPNAKSPAGAHGLMQLMPATAKGVAKTLNMKYKESSLTGIDYNLRLGTAFVQNQVVNFNGSYVLALAGYNAGPRRVRDWMSQIGDPRRPEVDAVDWIEMIPVSETRNYVQRIIESLQVYRARLSGGQAPLMILQDIKR